MCVHYSAKPKLNFANDCIFKMSNISMEDDLYNIFKRKMTLNCVFWPWYFVCLIFPLNMLFKCKGTTGSLSLPVGHTACSLCLASGVFKLSSVLLAVLPSWCVQGEQSPACLSGCQGSLYTILEVAWRGLYTELQMFLPLLHEWSVGS